MPLCCKLFKSVASFCLKYTSSPFVGSSNNRISGLHKSTIANAKRCCSPPERSNGCLSDSSCNSQNASISHTFFSASACGNPLCAATSQSSSQTVLREKRLCGFCGKADILLPLFVTTWPRYGWRSPIKTESTVDFPVPLPPISAYNSPLCSVSDRPLTTSASCFSYRNHISCAFSSTSLFAARSSSLSAATFCGCMDDSQLLPSRTVKGQSRSFGTV